MPEILSFEQALDASSAAKHRHILLGNGFSIACRPDIFIYKKLFQQANFGDIPRARLAFDALVTTDFERVIRALRDFAAVAHIYGSISAEAEADAVALREVLVHTIADSHPSRPGEITSGEYAQCKDFLSHFNRIFTVNYDLLLYWALMQDEIAPEVECDDGFRKPDDDQEAGYVTWEPENTYNQNVYYLHGALHLFDAQSELQKYTWTFSGVALINKIRESLTRGFFPLFVAEGTSDEKSARIRHSDYLSKAYRSFILITGPLFVYGHSLAENDEHILRGISKGKADSLFVSIHNNPDSESNKVIIRKAQSLSNLRPPKKPLTVHFFDAESAHVWR